MAFVTQAFTGKEIIEIPVQRAEQVPDSEKPKLEIRGVGIIGHGSIHPFEMKDEALDGLKLSRVEIRKIILHLLQIRDVRKQVVHVDKIFVNVIEVR